MDFTLTEEQQEFKAAAIKFAETKLRDDIIDRDKNSTFSRELWMRCADFGVQGIAFPEEYGGLGKDILTSMIVMEALGYACRDSGLIFGINAQMWSVQMPLLQFGSDGQKKRYLSKLCSGESIGGHGMSEPDSGSDAFSLRTTATANGDHYLLNGTKIFVTNAPVADIFIVFATIDKRKGFLGVSAFIVEKDFDGFYISNPIEKMGLRTVPMGLLTLEGCKVPKANRLGGEGNGAAIFNSSMEWERSCILAPNLGAMQNQLENCIEYVNTRKQFGKPIGTFQSVANRIVDMKMRLETARLLLYKAAWGKKQFGQAVTDTAIAKLYLSEAWVKSCLDAIQIHGGYGYTTEYEIERDLRDSIGGTLDSGTSEIQRNIVAQKLGL
jgi:alkylation response protein AidB-like acyl-CoA dehydrogenase